MVAGYIPTMVARCIPAVVPSLVHPPWCLAWYTHRCTQEARIPTVVPGRLGYPPLYKETGIYSPLYKGDGHILTVVHIGRLACPPWCT